MASSRSALHRISDKEHLRRAWKAINKRNLRSKGLDDVTIGAFKSNLDENLSQISSELKTGNYAFNKLRAHAIDKPGSAKKRPLQIAAVRDRVVMKAIATFISGAFDPFNLPCSFAYVKNGGVGPVVKRIHQLVAEGNGIYLEADIINFFGSVDKELLWKRFSKRVRYKSLLPLIRRCFDLELGNVEDLRAEDRRLFVNADSGIPQGGCLSPMLANFYLAEFDRKMLDSGFNLVRYADDFVVMCETKERAEQAHGLCKQMLKDLHLEIHELGSSKTRVGKFAADGLAFLGLRFVGGDVFPASKIQEAFRIKVREILKPNSGDSLFKTLQKLSNLIHGWGNYYSEMHVTQIYLDLDKYIKKSVRIYLRHLGIELVDKNRNYKKILGIPSLSAMVEHSRNVSGSHVGVRAPVPRGMVVSTTASGLGLMVPSAAASASTA